MVAWEGLCKCNSCWQQAMVGLVVKEKKRKKKSRMSGARLCVLHGELGYDGAGLLDPDSFEWPFQYDNACPVLDWICTNFRPSNILSLSELSQYEQFVDEGKLLKGEDLDFAFDSISAFSVRRDNQERREASGRRLAVWKATVGLVVVRSAMNPAKAFDGRARR